MRIARSAVSATVGVVALGVALAAAAPAAGAPSSYQHLNPGGKPSYVERVPVNVVFVGYGSDAVPDGRFRAELASRYQPLVQSRRSYGIRERLGVTYTYDYRITHASKSYEDAVFGRLSALAKPAPLTDYQKAYNRQKHNVLEVRNNSYIDAPSVERYLAEHPPAGVDTRQDTVFYLNWYGRPDFKFHVYTKTGEPDPDTGYDFGANRDSRKIIAWGGTPADDEETGYGSLRRVWFHDLSAGPEAWTNNWNVDDADADGDGAADYRLPPVWEYRRGGYRTPAKLASDLGLLTRYVAVDLLFTTSPLFPPDLPHAPDMPESINIDSNTYESWAGVDASKRFIKPGYLLNELREVRPLNQLSYDNQDFRLTGKARQCYLGEFVTDTSCYPAAGLPSFANLFLYNTKNLARTQDDGNRVDFELPNFNYAVKNDPGTTPLGYTDDNWRNGTQTIVANFLSPAIVASGYGLTTTIIHEDGHFLGLHHPHDGYDSETDTLFSAGGAFNFAWAGDQTNSMMSYIDLNWDFSQFDRDNMNRFLAAEYTGNANLIAARVLADAQRDLARDELRAADRLIGSAEAAFAGHAYLRASALAKAAYEQVRAAAGEVGVPVTSAPSDAAASTAAVTRTTAAVVDDPAEQGPRNLP